MAVNKVYSDSLKSRDKFLAFSDRTDSVARMIQSGFLSEEDRKALTALAREGSSPCRVSRRANALGLSVMTDGRCATAPDSVPDYVDPAPGHRTVQ